MCPSRLPAIVLALLWCSVPALALPGQYNATRDEGHVICVYPLSGQYGLLPRILYYSLLVFSVFARKYVWLVAGALASALTFSGTAAIHAVVLIAVANSNPSVQFDIDIVGVWAVVSAAFIAFDPVVEWSSTLRESQFRPIFNIWGVLVLIGSCCAAANLYYAYPSEAPCSGTECRQACLATSQALRAPSELSLVAEDIVFGLWSMLLWPSILLTLIFGFYSGLYGACLSSPRKRTEAELKDIMESNKGLMNSSTPKMKRQARAEYNAAKTELQTGRYPFRRTCCSYLSAVASPIVVILNETYLLAASGLPANEQPFAIGQWGPWVGISLALLAAAINAWYEPKWQERQQTLAEERRQFELRQFKPQQTVMEIKSSPHAEIASERAETTNTQESSGVVDPPNSSQIQKSPGAHLSYKERLERFELDFKTSKWRLRTNDNEIDDLEAGMNKD